MREEQQKRKTEMIKKEDAEQFINKVDMEGLSYSIENYIPKNTGDENFDKLASELKTAQENMEAYIEELRDTYGIEYS